MGPKRLLLLIEGKHYDKKPYYSRKGRKRFNWRNVNENY